MSETISNLVSGFLACGILVLVFKVIHWMTQREESSAKRKR
jgi:hypothetical protein